MVITIIGSTAYLPKIIEHQIQLQAQGHKVLVPAFDSHPNWNELQICEYNRGLIEQADRVHVIYDGRSLGTWGDFCMCFALRKPIDIIYWNPKSIKGVMELYAEACREEKA